MSPTLAEVLTQTAVCLGYDAVTGRPCDRPVHETLTAGCEHEHVGDRRLCRMHASDVRHNAMLCGNCLAIDGHHCRLRVLERIRS